jgi:hypothetical protein
MSYFSMNFLGGPPGISGQQNLLGYNDSKIVIVRNIVNKVYNKQNLQPSINGRGPMVGPFRLAMNAGDYLNRKNYSCNVPNQINSTRPGKTGRDGTVPNKCDGSGIPGSGTNNKYVFDSSDYITFKKQVAIQKNFNKRKQGGDNNNASYVPLQAVRH